MFAAALPAPSTGVDAQADCLYGWTAWPTAPEGRGWRVGDVAVLWEEPDRFNSEQLAVPVARLWYRFRDNVAVPPPPMNRGLVSARVVGHDARALGLLQAWGFRLVATYLWMVRAPGTPLAAPDGFVLVDLQRDPVDVEAILALAEECIYDDRFLLDPQVDPSRARARFLTFVRNLVTGGLARFLVLAGPREAPIGATFFQADTVAAGRWYTAFVKPEHRRRGIGTGMLRFALAQIGADRYWWIAATVQNRGSIGGAVREGFRLGGVCYDLHRWDRS